MNKQFKADFMLLVITVFWGISYVFTKVALEEVQEFNLIALRFILAFILAGTIFYRRIIKINFKTIKYAFILAIILFSVFVTMTYGVKYTSASNAGFLISLTVILVPAFSTLIFKQKPELSAIIGCILALLGVALLTLNENLSVNLGDLLMILCAALYAIHIIITGRFTKEVDDSIALGVLQLGIIGALAFLFSLIFETPKLPSSNVWLEVIILSIFCTAIAFIVQTTAQKFTTPVHTALIFALEPIFAAIFGYLYLREILSSREYIGAVILIMGTFFAEFDVAKLIKEKSSKAAP